MDPLSGIEMFRKRSPKASLTRGKLVVVFASCGQTVDVAPSKRLKLTLSITDVEARRGEKLTPC